MRRTRFLLMLCLRLPVGDPVRVELEPMLLAKLAQFADGKPS